MDKSIYINYRLGTSIFCFILILSIALPTLLTIFKLFLLTMIIALILIFSINNKRGYYDRDLILIAIFYSFLGLAYSIFGLTNNNPGAIQTIALMAVYPILFTLISFFLRTKKDVLTISKVLIFSSLIVVIIQVVFLLSAYGFITSIISEYFKAAHPDFAVLDVQSDYFLFTLPNVSSFIFLIPFLSTYILLSLKIDYKLIALLILMTILILLTGRRAFFVSFFISFVFLYFILIFIRENFRTNINFRFLLILLVICIIVFPLISYSDLSLEVYIDKVQSIFNFSDNDSNLERVYQFNSLMKEIYKYPLFGHGAGAVADYIRSDDQPWTYELSYIAFIFHYGIFGFLVYLIGVIFIILSLLNISSKESIDRDVKVFIIAFVTGMISFLIANATNPYLAKFDYVWVLFIPVMIINIYRVDKTKLY